MLDAYNALPDAAKFFLDILTASFAPVTTNKIAQMARYLERDFAIKANLETLIDEFLVDSVTSHWGTRTVLPELKVHLFDLFAKEQDRYDEALHFSKAITSYYTFEKDSKLLISLRDFLIDFLENKGKDLARLSFEIVPDPEEEGAVSVLFYAMLNSSYKGIEQYLGKNALLRIVEMAIKEKYERLNTSFDFKVLVNRIRKVPAAAYMFPEPYNFLFAEGALEEGDFGFLRESVKPESRSGLFALASLRLIEGDAPLALKYFEAGLKVQKKLIKQPFPHLPVYKLCYAQTLAQLKNEGCSAVITKLLKNKDVKSDAITYSILAINGGIAREDIIDAFNSIKMRGWFDPVEKVILQLIGLNYDLKMPDHFKLDGSSELLDELGLKWLGLEQATASNDILALSGLQEQLNVSSIFASLKIEKEWERILNALIGKDYSVDVANASKSYRIAYLVDYDDYSITPIQQQSKDGIVWSKGKSVSLQRFSTYEVDGMSDQDKRIADCVERDSYYRRMYTLNLLDAARFLIGHPYIFMAENPTIPIEIVELKPELTITKNDSGYHLALNIDDISEPVQLIKETNTRLKVMNLSKSQQNILSMLLQVGQVPKEGKDKLLELLKKLNGVLTVYTDLIDSNSSLQTIDGDSRIFVQIIPIGDTLKAELFVKPFTTEAPYCKAGVGASNVIGEKDGLKAQAKRNLDQERANWLIVKDALDRIVMDVEDENDIYIFDDPYRCLEFMETIKSLVDISVLEWPEGVKYRITGYAQSSNMSITLRSRSQWFELEGELKVGEDKIFSMQEILRAARNSKGRFIELGDGEYLALTEQFRKQLLELDAYVQDSKDGLMIQQFTSSIFEELEKEGVRLQADKQYYDFRSRLQKQENTEYQTPVNLQAELRDYQSEGFRWMARLDGWGAGACLADDMGLGKTVQTIAMLLHKAAEGPTLVIAPASVQPNWIREINRFAPSLNIVNLSPVQDRLEKIRLAQANDVCIVTYGVLVTEEEYMTKKEWAMVALDEAHTIKNKETKMSKAAMKLKAGFRLILTGTPIQNHLGEIWNLFNFINPGLLGSFERFRDRFVTPIVEMKDKEQQRRLKKLISPFLLRRTKSAVLDELPPKTEIVKEVQLSEAEVAAYELLRREAETKLTQEGEITQIQALAEITRLRMAACNINLVNKNIDLPSSKIETFLDVVDELRDNNHRALVFSQFTSHLALIRKALDEKGISYLYLDGSTTIPERERLVKQYQSGDELLFLISLKAGGLGLNLTAADFVIHMDPWWNPAIEDQASDRAYRIGQTRPVTIYRLIAKDTIEEKIIRLHATKKDLADSLLEGTDLSHKMSREDLLDLLKG